MIHQGRVSLSSHYEKKKYRQKEEKKKKRFMSVLAKWGYSATCKISWGVHEKKTEYENLKIDPNRFDDWGSPCPLNSSWRRAGDTDWCPTTLLPEEKMVLLTWWPKDTLIQWSIKENTFIYLVFKNLKGIFNMVFPYDLSYESYCYCRWSSNSYYIY